MIIFNLKNVVFIFVVEKVSYFELVVVDSPSLSSFFLSVEQIAQVQKHSVWQSLIRSNSLGQKSTTVFFSVSVQQTI
jgi:hypothetical protein